MNRTQLEDNSGMLFLFDREQVLNFWMKNTLIPLSIAYINKNCEIVDIQQMYPYKNPSDLTHYPSKSPGKYALEVNLGWFQKNNIKVGDKIKKQNGEFEICH